MRRATGMYWRVFLPDFRDKDEPLFSGFFGNLTEWGLQTPSGEDRQCVSRFIFTETELIMTALARSRYASRTFWLPR